jgi:chaperone required for assembly of F1-ATPase
MVDMQNKYWKPLLDWVNSEFGTSLKTTYGINSIKQSERDIQILRNHINTFDSITLAGIVFDFHC